MLNIEPQRDPSQGWITSSAFASAAGVQPRRARRALARCATGGTWRGHRLEVAAVPAAGGVAYRVAVHSMPDDLRARLKDLQSPVMPAEEVNRSVWTREADAALEVWANRKPATMGDLTFAERFLLIEDADTAARHGDRRGEALDLALTTSRGTAERAAAIAAAAAAADVSERTLRRWLERREQRGAAGLARKRRADAGKTKAVTWSALDRALRAAGWDEAAIAELGTRIRRLARSLYAELGEIGAPTLANLLSWKIAAMLAETGAALPVALCRPPAAFVRRERRYRLLGIKRSDAGRWASEFTPRITRHRKGLGPGDLVAGDVMPGNVWFRRTDGSECTARVIAWLDLATGRARFDVIVPPRGESIRQEHMVRSFKAMAADAAWGPPSCLYVDNGPEYGWAELINPLAALKIKLFGFGADQDARPGLRRALPYNPQAKAIEGVFSAFQATVEPLLPGYIGGHRMRKLVEHQGRPPKPFPGDEEALISAYQKAAVVYNASPHGGHLDGVTPDQAFAMFVENGRQPRAALDPTHADLHLARREQRIVDRGGIVNCGGRRWFADALMTAVAERVEVRIPYDPSGERLYVCQGEQCLAIAEPERAFSILDPAGAGESSRRRAAQNAQLAAMRQDVDPIDRLELLDALAAAAPAPPELPETEVVIGFDPGLQRDVDRLDAERAERAASSWSPERAARLARRGWSDYGRASNRARIAK